eukprot:CAMPEP_0194259084 /NCGR_PEP_ID=MMETSP0158-20130606/42753_1 /TAXON_ID=33649 /ORGANISM="Thalassionema nitzschioides, Strain L26-B" /LENGTH=88 /DNA_ID=CAMNT_0038998735 /DNA_START=16 /DNA_END=282 /DNA_ORIENTATION=+
MSAVTPIKYHQQYFNTLTKKCKLDFHLPIESVFAPIMSTAFHGGVAISIAIIQDIAMDGDYETALVGLDYYIFGNFRWGDSAFMIVKD